MRSAPLTIIAAVINYSYAGTKFAGPFVIQVQHPFICEDQGTQDILFVNATIRKKAKNFYGLTSKVTMKVPIDDSLAVKINLAVWGNGGWRPNFMMMEYKNACTSFGKMMPGIFEYVLQANDLTGCPIPEGEYWVQDADASPKVDMESLPYNKYKAHIKFVSQDGTLVGCLGMVTNVVPKNKKG